MFWGEVDEFDQSWRGYAERNPNVEIIFMKFEDFIKDKNSHIKKLAEFIGFENPNIDEIIENSTLEATINRRKAKWENLGCKFWEIVCYRKVRSFKKLLRIIFVLRNGHTRQFSGSNWVMERRAFRRGQKIIC